MIQNTVQFDFDEAWRALEENDPAFAMTHGLCSNDDQPLTAPADMFESLALMDGMKPDPFQISAADPLHILSVAARSVFAASHLLGPAVVTAGVLSSVPSAQLVLAAILQHIPGLSHVALYAEDCPAHIEPRLVDHLDLAGIGYFVAHSICDAVRGANLVIAYDSAPPDLRIGQLSPRCVVVNATGIDLPGQLVDGIDHVFVDNAELLDANRHRHFTSTHPRIADFHALRHTHARPHQLDHIVLVELLG